MDLTAHWVNYLVLGIYIAAYGIVINEEFTDLRKSKPAVLPAGLIWALRVRAPRVRSPQGLLSPCRTSRRRRRSQTCG
jgi:hypothetical protein